MLTLQQRIESLVVLGKIIRLYPKALSDAVNKACMENPWFTQEGYGYMLSAIEENFLNQEKLDNFAQSYPGLASYRTSKRVGLIMAGNLPLVGFHDLLCVILAGHRCQIKQAEKDQWVWPVLVHLWKNDYPALIDYIGFEERLSGFDAVIATGSNLSSRYFHKYFGQYPHLIRQNRNSLALLTGDESSVELELLGQDIFAFYGLGCRNVSSLILPLGFDIKQLLDCWRPYDYVINNHKYKHNFDYHLATLIINNLPYHENGFVILQPNSQLASKVAMVHYQTYDNLSETLAFLSNQDQLIQVIVSQKKLPGWKHVYFGTSQQPELNDFADRVDTLAFLLQL